MNIKSVLFTLTTLLIGLSLAETYTVSGGSTASYRVREQLANVSLPNDAVGTTGGVSGSIVLNEDGSIGVGSSIVVDANSLESDQNRRDTYLRRNTLQTDTYPVVTFVPTELRGLTFPLPESGEASFEILGDLTIRDVTRPVVWQATATFGNTVRLQGSTVLTFEDFEMRKPQVGPVLGVEDDIGLEIDLVLEAAR